jgi:hypothetical protein
MHSDTILTCCLRPVGLLAHHLELVELLLEVVLVLVLDPQLALVLQSWPILVVPSLVLMVPVLLCQ